MPLSTTVYHNRLGSYWEANALYISLKQVTIDISSRQLFKKNPSKNYLIFKKNWELQIIIFIIINKNPR